MPRLAVLLLVLGVFAAGCGTSADGPVVGAGTGSPAAAAPAASSPVADASAAAYDRRVWFEVLGVSQAAPSGGVLELGTSAADVTSLWQRYGMPGEAPDVDLNTTVVLFVGRGDDSCPDDLVAATEQYGVLETTWLPPPGGCEQPYIPTGHAVALHRADLGEEATIALRDELDGDTVATFALPPFDGPSAPTPPDVPTQPDEDGVAALFDGHQLRPCTEFPGPLDERGQVDGPVSDDHAVAAAQQARADKAFPSDLDTVTALLADPANLERGWGFPLTQAEFDALMGRGQVDLQVELESYLTDHGDTYGFRYLSHVRGGATVIGFTGGLDVRRAEVAERFPTLTAEVVAATSTQREREQVVEALFATLRHDSPDGPRLSSGSPGLERVEVGLIDPTRADLDTLAALVEDPSLLCLTPEFNGVPADEPASEDLG